MPKFKFSITLLVSLLLLTLTLTSVWLLYQNRNQRQAFVPQKNFASQIEVSDNFDAATLDTTKWDTNNPCPLTCSSTLSNGKLLMQIDVRNTTNTFYDYDVRMLQHATNDFEAEVDVEPIITNNNTDGAAANLAFGDLDPYVAGQPGFHMHIARRFYGATESIETNLYQSTSGYVGSVQTTLPPGTGTVRLRITRVGNTISSYYKTNTSSTYTLLKSFTNTWTGSGIIQLYTSVLANYPATTAKYDNFWASATFFYPSPTPMLSSTPFPSSTPLPSATPQDSPYVTPTATPISDILISPTPTPAIGGDGNCNTGCETNSQCQTNYICYITAGQTTGVCRNPSCQLDADCSCDLTQVISTPTPVASVIPNVPTAGNSFPTLLLLGGGLLLLILGMAF